MRLNRLKVNATLLARGEELLPVGSGNDEIAELDQTFHMASDLINTAMRKEKSHIEKR